MCIGTRGRRVVDELARESAGRICLGDSGSRPKRDPAVTGPSPSTSRIPTRPRAMLLGHTAAGGTGWMTTIERVPSGVASPTTSVADVVSLARETGVLIVDLRFVDLPGQAQHFSIPVRELSENLFIDGI